ncbi:MAG: enolase C-terminal domain-like protein [Phycisphaerae bacterium]|nr:enolase C-terminal domain-like protein [Phycisphaerae bacterium]
MSQLNRRQFIAGAAGLAGSLYVQRSPGAEPMKSVKIDRIETFPLTYPTAGRFKFFEGPKGESLGRQTVVVKITADDGTVGWGQSVPTHKWSYETLETVHTTIERYLTPVLIGLDPFDLPAVRQAMDAIIAPSFSTGQPICKAGIDLALFDLTGKLLRQTAQERWKHKGRDKVLLSWTLNPKTLDDIPRLIDEGRQHGYHNFNVKVAPDPKFDVEMCTMVKKLVPDGFLWADANGGYDEATAVEVLPKLAKAGVAVLEQPLKPSRISGYQRLKKIGGLPILMDEGIINTGELEEFIKLGMLDGVAMKPARCGGITEARAQIELCLKKGLMWLGSGLTDPDISLAASLLLYGAYDLRFPAALNGPQFLSKLSILKKPLVPTDGHLPVPTEPGLGVEVDEQKLEEHRIKKV